MKQFCRTTTSQISSDIDTLVTNKQRKYSLCSFVLNSGEEWVKKDENMSVHFYPGFIIEQTHVKEYLRKISSKFCRNNSKFEN